MKGDNVLIVGERFPNMTALWNEATIEKRREIVMLILEPGGLHYAVDVMEIAAVTLRPVFLPVLRFFHGSR